MEEEDSDLVLSYEEWMPTQIQQRFPTLGEALSRLCHNPKEAEAATAVFWQLCYHPEVNPDDEVTLSRIEVLARPRGEPDSLVEDQDCQTYLLVASALLRQVIPREGYSERAEEILRCAFRLLVRPHALSTQTLGLLDFTIRASTLTASGLLHLHRARWLRLRDRPDEALADFHRALSCWDEITSDSSTWFHIDDLKEWWDEVMEGEPTAKRIAVATQFWLKAAALNLQEIVDAFLEMLEPSAQERNWRHLELLCVLFRYSLCHLLNNEYVEDTRGQAKDDPTSWMKKIGWSWSGFWDYARGKAQERLSPSELTQSLSYANTAQSEKVIKTYFFSDLWDELPEEAKRRLVNAAEKYLNPTIGYPLSLLNDLQKATQVILLMLYEPFKEWVNQNKWATARLPEEKARDLKYQLSAPKPGFADILQIMWAYPTFLDGFLHSMKLEKNEIVFVNDLRHYLNWLRKKRNDAEYRYQRVEWRECKHAMNVFLGIGCRGIIPCLLRI